ncbi:MAG: ABC transporter permease [Candidatus Woesearchaeota archaeon]
MVFKNMFILLTIILKNLKLVLRNPTSLLMLILGPLILIMLIGFAFGSDDVHDISMGYISSNPANTHQVTDALSSDRSNDITIYQEYSLDDCLLRLKLDTTQVCALFSDDFIAAEQQVSGKITFYYDNSRYNLVSYLKEYITSKIAITSEQITLEAAANILGDIQTAVRFMENTRFKIDEFMNNIYNMKIDLENTKYELIEIRDDIEPLYQDALILQKNYDSNAQDINSSLYLLNEKKQDVKSAIMTLNSTIDIVKSNLKTSILSNDIISLIEYTVSQLDILQKELDNLIVLMDKYNAQLNQANNEFASKIYSTVSLLEKTLNFINLSIIRIDNNIILLNETYDELQSIKQKLDDNIAKFSELDPSKAQSLVKPITSRFEGILGDISKINLVFPIVLVFMIMFISILLSNITVLNEIHSQSYFRNFLVPVKNSMFVLGLFITNLIVVLFQIFVLLVIANIKFNVDLTTGLPSLIAVIFLVSSTFILIGMSIGYFIRKKETSILASTFIALAIFLFSDMIFPAEAMPKFAGFLAKLNPLVLGETMIRKIIYHGIMLDYQISDLSILIIYVIVMAIIVLIAAKRNKKIS